MEIYFAFLNLRKNKKTVIKLTVPRLFRENFSAAVFYAQIPAFVKLQIIVMMEKNPKQRADTAENANAK